MNNDIQSKDLRIIRIRDVIAITSMSRSAVYAAVKAGTFPRQVKLSARSAGWVLGEVLDWVKDRPRAS